MPLSEELAASFAARRNAMSRVISLVSSATATETRDIRVDKVLEAIRTGGKKLKGQITQIRNRFDAELAITGDREKAKRVIDAFKKQLQAVTWSGRFSHRANDKLVEHSGLQCADLDLLGERLPEIWKKLAKSQHVLALFRSPTGDGIKAVFRVPAEPVMHSGSFRAIKKHVRELTADVQIDESCKDLARLCFMSYDPELHVNENAREITPLLELKKTKAQTNGVINRSDRQRIAVEVLGSVDWESETSGFCTCPGKHLHTTGDGERDCKLELDKVPTVHCFHDRCRVILDAINHELRSRISKAEYAKPKTPTHVEVQSQADAQSKESDNVEDETIARLASMSLSEYERARKDVAKQLGFGRVSTLDTLVHAQRLLMRPPSDSDNLQGVAVKLADVEPWPESVNGAEILDAIAQRFSLYIVLPEGAADTLTLWCTHTHLFKVFEHTPRAIVSAPMHRCGKTITRNLSACFCNRALKAENLATAVVYRLIDAQCPTILADEFGGWLGQNEELQKLLNSGHERRRCAALRR